MHIRNHEDSECRPQCNTKRLHIPFRNATLSAIVILVLAAGCKERGCPISGQVTFDGKPVVEGTIAFEPADGQGATTGGKIADGKYSLIDNASPMPGKKRVRIMAARKTGRRVPAGPPAPPTMMIDEIVRYIPDIYNQRTTLACEIAHDGPREIDFHLKSQ